MLLPPDLRDWVPQDDMVHFVIEAVEGMKFTTLKINRRGSGSQQYPPKMMLGLLIYCYANGIFSSRRIERATYRDIGVRYLTGDTHPDHDTICTFRRENFEAVGEAFLQVLHLAREMGVLKVGTVSVDGTHIRANASKDKNVRYDRAGELERQLRSDVQRLLQEAERKDRREEDDGQSLPKEIGNVSAVLADSGYVNGDAWESLEQEEVDLYVAVSRAENHSQRQYDYRPTSVTNKPAKVITDQRLLDMREKLRTDVGRRLYAKRKQTVEPVFGIIKHVMGFRQFLLRGLGKVSGEWELVRLAYNVRRLWVLKTA